MCLALATLRQSGWLARPVAETLPLFLVVFDAYLQILFIGESALSSPLSPVEVRSVLEVEYMTVHLISALFRLLLLRTLCVLGEFLLARSFAPSFLGYFLTVVYLLSRY